MILIFSQDADTIAKIARNQANASQAVFGPSRNAFQTTQVVAPKDNLFIVANLAKNGSDWWPVVGDEATDRYWTATQALVVMRNTIPESFSGNVYVAACSLAAPDSGLKFARAFQAQLVAQKRSTSKVFGHADAARGPIPPPGDKRWLEVQAA